ncbi:MAG: L-serine dehydratase, alpha chain [Candidatus Heimdallarchaeota archaeon LC_3]|nr:MAG: L-serine dehydratase, alpha chain [Candidatus Heimdallarchaeota archaeon LC_3]
MNVISHPSIFNDVIGPIMRGPSSSHCAASVRIGRIARDLMDGNIEEVKIVFDCKGSLATTHESQGSDMGLYGGFTGWEAYDERLLDYINAVEDTMIRISIDIKDLSDRHPNTYNLLIKNSKEHHQMVAISTGGGMIEIIEIDGIKVSMIGDYYETLIFSNDSNLKSYLQRKLDIEVILLEESNDNKIIELKSSKFLDKETKNDLMSKFDISSIKEINPVLPILSRKGIKLPFTTSEQMFQYNKEKNLDLWELAVIYESIRGNISKQEVFQKMKNICKIMRKSILEGLEGTEYNDRILDNQSGEFKDKMKNNKLLGSGVLNQMILNITAIMEVKSSMGVIVAAPTAGSCGTLPGSLIAVTEIMELPEDELVKAMFAAGIIGLFISIHATFAAELGGCQAECGSASGMAAAGLVYLGKGNIMNAISAASMALQNVLGMVCDPVGNRVEVPCLGKNIIAASNALSCANMALANYDPVLPLDEVIEAMNKVGNSIPSELRCTILGGLSVTKTSKKLENKLKKRKLTSNKQKKDINV